MPLQVDPKFISSEMTTDTELAAEASARTSEDLTFVKLDGSRPMTGNLDMNSNKVTNVTEPANSNDAANKEYVERIAYYFSIVL